LPTQAHKKELRRATILVVASIFLAIIFALLPKNSNNSNLKSSYLESVNKQGVSKKNISKDIKRDDIKVLELDDFGSTKPRD